MHWGEEDTGLYQVLAVTGSGSYPGGGRRRFQRGGGDGGKLIWINIFSMGIIV